MAFWKASGGEVSASSSQFSRIVYHPGLSVVDFVADAVRFSRCATIVDKTMAINTTVPIVISEIFVGISI